LPGIDKDNIGMLEDIAEPKIRERERRIEDKRISFRGINVVSI
jgi:hypothetical protein